jgi:broad specificity phosphatase PhoE
MKLYFLRHGESEANVLNEISNRGRRHGLTEQGRQQAAALARALRDAAIVRMFCSPLLRAVETAEIVSGALGLPYDVTDALREYDCGELEGRSDAATWQRYSDLFQAWIERGAWEQRIEGGESFLDMQRRFVPFVEQIVREHRHGPGGIALIGHGGLYRCMLPLVLDNVDVRFAVEHPISHTGAIVADPRGERLVCTRWCDSGDLPAAGCSADRAGE